MGWRIVMLALVPMALWIGCSRSSGANTAGGDTAAGGGADLPTVTFTVSDGSHVPLRVEVADNDSEKGCGLMHRTELPDDQGMLFVFTADSTGGFWMRNTLIPLSIAYTAADGRIVDILDMQPVPAPGNTPYRLPDGRVVPVGDGQQPPAGAVWETYPPRAPYRYAIEVNQGWFDRHGIAIGNHVDLATALANADRAVPPPICAERGQ
jgi:uncharacterized membrane protein (UPF0127 family)